MPFVPVYLNVANEFHQPPFCQQSFQPPPVHQSYMQQSPWQSLPVNQPPFQYSPFHRSPIDCPSFNQRSVLPGAVHPGPFDHSSFQKTLYGPYGPYGPTQSHQPSRIGRNPYPADIEIIIIPPASSNPTSKQQYSGIHGGQTDLRQPSTSGGHKKSSSNASADFEVEIDVYKYNPNEVSVKVVNNFVVVEGKQKEFRYEEGLASYGFTRRYELPPGVNAKDVVAEYTSDGFMTIRASREVRTTEESKVHDVPIKKMRFEWIDGTLGKIGGAEQISTGSKDSAEITGVVRIIDGDTVQSIPIQHMGYGIFEPIPVSSRPGLSGEVKTSEGGNARAANKTDDLVDCYPNAELLPFQLPDNAVENLSSGPGNQANGQSLGRPPKDVMPISNEQAQDTRAEPQVSDGNAKEKKVILGMNSQDGDIE